jgi:hypothetical protein
LFNKKNLQYLFYYFKSKKMKKLFKSSLAILIGLSLTISACKKEDTKTDEGNNNGTGTVTIPQEQKSTLFYFGGTWCPPCGAYGKPAKEQIKASAVGPKTTIISCQVGNDPMKCADADLLSAIFSPAGVPAMYIGANDAPFVSMIGGSTSTGTTAINTITTQVVKTAVVNCVLTMKEADGLLNVVADGKFFADATGEYHIAGYMLEDKLNYVQSSDASVEKNIHYNVIRTKFGTVVTGELIKADPKKDDTFKKELNFFIPSTSVKANISVAVVIWKKTATGWVASNSTKVHL